MKRGVVLHYSSTDVTIRISMYYGNLSSPPLKTIKKKPYAFQWRTGHPEYRNLITPYIWYVCSNLTISKSAFKQYQSDAHQHVKQGLYGCKHLLDSELLLSLWCQCKRRPEISTHQNEPHEEPFKTQKLEDNNKQVFDHNFRFEVMS